MKRYAWIALALAAGAPLTGWAQIIDQQRPDRRPPEAPRPRAPQAAPASPEPAPVVEAEAEAAAAPLRRVVVEGSSLPQPAFDAAMRPLIGKPLNRATAAAAADAAAGVYARSDIALYTIVAPRQDLAGGELRLRAVEGYVAQVALKGDTKGDLKLVGAYGEKLTRERPLRRPTLERYLSLIRDIPGLTVEAQLLRGQTPGAVVLALALEQDRTGLDVSVNNAGSAILGRTQLQATGNLYGLLRQGDQTSLTLGLPTDAERFHYYAFSHSQPIGSEGLRAQVSAGYLRTRPENPPRRGEATLAGLQLSYPVIRGYTQNLYVSGALDGLNSSNAVFGQGTATERTRVIRAAVAWSRQKPKSALSASAVASGGLDALGARTTPGLAEADFRKLNLRLGADRALGKAFVVRLRAGGQATGDLLPASEQFALGGPEFGRAYEQSIILGDRGLAGSAELAWRPQPLPKGLQGSELYVFADGGTLTRRGRLGFASQRDDLASSGGGVRVAAGSRTMFGVEGAYGWDPPIGRGKAWRLGLSVRATR